ncbi:nuclear pore complex-interacting protein family member B3-like [Rhinopithecus roxellana]|uniref:nuclear pore complex-interacting protein family member B3-like n=1 Tax=Rhinopithecus roxellana TaxID=61622 RepID=UPI0012375CA5|nr:nuclear pore complex-interacting protein family member B3-like [Rhinopithecus roxellana]
MDVMEMVTIGPFRILLMFSCLGYEWMSGTEGSSRPEAGTGSWLGRTRNQKVISYLPDHFQPGPDFFGIPWRAIIIVFLGISTLGIFLWKTSFGVSFLKIVLKLQNVHDRSTDVQRRAWRSNSRRQEGLRSTCTHTKKRVSSFPGIKIALEDLFTSRSFMEARVRAEVHKVTTKVNSHYQINGQRKTTEKGESFQGAQELQWRAEDSYRRKIAPSARKALDNQVSLFVLLAFGHSLPGQNVDVFFSPQLFAQTLQWEMTERKAYKQHGCEMREKQRMPERHMSEESVQERPGLKNPFWRADSGSHSVPMRSSHCVPAGNTEKTKVSMVAGKHHHSSGLPYYPPYLMAETVRQWMAHQLPPPSQYHLGAQPLPSAKRFLGPPTISQLKRPLGPQEPSTTDDFRRPQSPPVDCPLGPQAFSPADDSRRLQTPHECLLVPPPSSPADDYLTLQTPPECLRVPLPPSPPDDFQTLQTPPECHRVPLPPSPPDDFQTLQRPPERLRVPLPPSPPDDFQTLQTPPKCLRAPLPPSPPDFQTLQTPPECLRVPLPPSPPDDFQTLQTPPECLWAPLPPSPPDYFQTLQTPPEYTADAPECLRSPLPPSPPDDFQTLQTPPECLRVPLPPSPPDDFQTLQTPPEYTADATQCLRAPLPPSPPDYQTLQSPPECFWVPLPPSPPDDFQTLQTPPECLRAPLPPSPPDDFQTLQTPPECLRTLQTPPKCLWAPLPPSPPDYQTLQTPPECFWVPLPPSPPDDFQTLQTPPECLRAPLPPSPPDDFQTLQTPPECLLVNASRQDIEDAEETATQACGGTDSTEGLFNMAKTFLPEEPPRYVTKSPSTLKCAARDTHLTFYHEHFQTDIKVERPLNSSGC